MNIEFGKNVGDFVFHIWLDFSWIQRKCLMIFFHFSLGSFIFPNNWQKWDSSTGMFHTLQLSVLVVFGSMDKALYVGPLFKDLFPDTKIAGLSLSSCFLFI